nr:transposase-like protein [Colletotrichum truncatum]KAF6794135.1 transposase-like protein [Colletotrichum truncatum]
MMSNSIASDPFGPDPFASDCSAAFELVNSTQTPTINTPPSGLQIQSEIILFVIKTFQTFLSFFKTLPWYLQWVILGKHTPLSKSPQPERKRFAKSLWTLQRRVSFWDHFHQGYHMTSGEPKLVCKHCHQVFNHPTIKNSGTSAMQRHLAAKSCKTRRLGANQVPGTQLKAVSEHQALVYCIVGSNLALNTVDNLSFRQFCSHLNPLYHLPSRKTLRSWISEEALRIQHHTLQLIPPGSYVSLMIDIWSTPGLKYSLLGVLCHFIDKHWRLQQVLLGAIDMTDGHTASKQATALSTLLENIRQRTKKTIRFQTVSADNASSFKPKVLAQELAKGSTSTVQPIYHIRCLAHIFNLVVRAIFEALRISMVEASTEFEPSTTRAKDQEDSDDDFDTEDSTARENPFGAVIQKIRDLAVSLKLSSKKTQEFLDLQKSTRIGQRPLRLLRDVKTRWNSTTLMCLRARELKTTISAWVEKHSLQEQFSLVETDWEALDILLDITSPFLLFTNILSRLNDLTPGHTFTLLQVATVHLYFCASALKDKVTSKDFTWISILQAATKKG